MINRTEGNRPVSDIQTFYNAFGDFRLINVSTSNTAEIVAAHQGVHSFRVPEQSGDIIIHPQFSLGPNFETIDKFADILDKMGVILHRHVVVENFFGTFKSKYPLISLVVHGYIQGQQHLTIPSGIESQHIFSALRDKLLDLGIRSPELFISCDPQADEQETINIRIRRFGQDSKHKVLSFPYLINTITFDDQGALVVKERDMKQEAKANSGSPFANPLTADYHLLEMVRDLFDCPPRFLELMNERLESQIKITTK